MPSKPASRQLSYLKALADRTGQSFIYPRTAAEASAQINRLKNARSSSRTERRVERKLIADQIQAGPADSAGVRDDEISGHGSSATWTQNRDAPGARGSRPGRPCPAHCEGRRAYRARALQRPRRRARHIWAAGGRDRPGH